MPTLSLSRYQINEWRLFSYSTSVSSTVNPAGFTLTQVGVKFNLAREYQHYLTKIVTPLSVLAINAHLIHFLPVTSLTDRMANTFTMFLAAFALLYVVGDTVPPLDCLTNIDRIIFQRSSSCLGSASSRPSSTIWTSTAMLKRCGSITPWLASRSSTHC